MNSLYLEIIMGICENLPSAIKDVAQMVKEAESSDDAKSKIKAFVTDTVKLLSTIGSAI